MSPNVSSFGQAMAPGPPPRAFGYFGLMSTIADRSHNYSKYNTEVYILVTIIIVNYQTAGLTLDCLNSLFSQRSQYPDFNVIVVDNNSGDNSVRYLEEKIYKNNWIDWVSLLPLSINNGFSSGNNAALEKIIRSKECPEYILLLNPDTTVELNAIFNLAIFLEKHNAAGVVGAQLQDVHGRLELTGRRFPSPISELINGARFGFLSKHLQKWQVNQPFQENAFQCSWVSGAAMMVRRKVFEQVGLMDDNYFLYFEEVDFCRRASLSGWQIWMEPKSVITHIEGQSTRIQKKRERRKKYWYDSRRRFFVKHYGVVFWIAADFLWTIGRFSWFLRKILKLTTGKCSEPSYFTIDLLFQDLHAFFTGDVFKIKHKAVSSDRINHIVDSRKI
jgi:N-acetylglucosaminyl-diphospho-decaprenol L-rhamnosyltransferase